MKRFTLRFSLLLLAVSLAWTAGCSPKAPAVSADLVLQNGLIFTVDGRSSRAEAAAVKDGKFVYVGTDSGAAAFIGKTTKVVDLQKRLVLPGFIDSHCHVISSYRHFFELNIFGLTTIEAIQKAIRDFAAARPGAKTMNGRGWSNTDFPKTGPDKKIIDAVVADIPVSIESEDGHSRWVNSKALALAGITKETKNPLGGVIERDPATGEPTGTLRESAADLVSGLFPPYTEDQLIQGIEAYQKMALAFGITTAHDAYLDSWSSETPAFAALERKNRLSLRVRASLYVDPEKGVEQVAALVRERERNKGELFQTNGAKLFLDGVVEGSTAYLKEPYRHLPGFRGEPIWKIEALEQVCAALDRERFQLHAHSIGDAATSEFLDALASVRKTNGPRDGRTLITHLQLVDKADFPRFKELGVVAVPQPYWFAKDNYYFNLQVPYLGQKRADEEYPMRSFFEAGVVVASASDYPVTVPCNPLVAIQMGITREEPGKTDPNLVLWPEERVTLEQMIRSFTINGAFANFLEDATGSIEVGKWADLIVLDKNLFEIPPAEISTAKVLLTLFEGKTVFSAAPPI
ncbi:MAG: amidohydrolase [Candidatus Aminicenantales bacterium]